MPTAFLNGYQPLSFKDFSGGLNLRDKSDAVNVKEAIDLLNVSFTDRGAVRTRDGLTDTTLSDLSARVNSMSPFQTVAGLRHLVASLDDGTLIALNPDGTPVSSISGLAGSPCIFARFGSPLTEYLYAANGIDTIRRWDGASWADGSVIATVNGTSGVAMPRAGAVCVTAQAPGQTAANNANNRLVATAFGTNPAAGPGGAPTTPSRVYWSNKGDPHTWETDGAQIGGVGTAYRGRNFMDLTPGDGEQIMGACSWRELTFIFKETKFFVFWGESTNTDGTPVFNYREVVNQAGLATRHTLVAGRDGVYFVNSRGVYVTTGSEPKLLSDVVKPMWTQDPDVYFQSDPINLTALDKARAHWHKERFYLAVPTGLRTVNDRMLSYDINYNWWTLYDLPASALATYRVANIEELHAAYSTAKPYPARIGRLVLGVETDRGDPIVSRWRSGWTDDDMSVQHTQREAKLWGTGALDVCFSVDFELVERGHGQAVLGVGGVWPTTGTWDEWTTSLGGSWPGSRQPADDLVRFGLRGTLFSTSFESTDLSPVWSVNRLSRHIRETREASIR
jgi:hypothetical protein